MRVLGLRVLEKVAIVLLILLVVTLMANSILAERGDYRNFWEAGRHFLTGQPVYDAARDWPEGYKYPPWVTPLLAPFSIFDLKAAGVFWRLVQVACLIWVTKWCADRCARRVSAWIVGLALWGTWMYNIVQGQITICLLALALFGYTRLEKNPTVGGSALLIALSAKVFNLVSLLGVRPPKEYRRTILGVAGVLTLFTLPSLLGYEGWSPLSMITAFQASASAPSPHLGGAGYGLPSLWIRLFSLDPSLTSSRITGFLISAALMAGFIWGTRKRIPFGPEKFAMALALGVAIHPLAYSYAFGWVFPLGAFAVDRAFFSASGAIPRILAVAGILGVTILDRLVGSLAAWAGVSVDLPIRALSIWVLAFALAWSFEPRARSRRGGRR